MASYVLPQEAEISYRYPDFQQQIAICALIHRWNPNLNTELAAIATALASDTTTHDQSLQTPPAALKLGTPPTPQTRLTNDLILAVNKGKAGNLPNATMVAAIDGVAGVLAPPGVVDVPYVYAVGAVANVTNGNWIGTPGSYAYAWKRDGTVAIGANANAYTMVGADTGHQIGCIVTATNATGSTAAPLSNTVTGP